MRYQDIKVSRHQILSYRVVPSQSSSGSSLLAPSKPGLTYARLLLFSSFFLFFSSSPLFTSLVLATSQMIRMTQMTRTPRELLKPTFSEKPRGNDVTDGGTRETWAVGTIQVRSSVRGNWANSSFKQAKWLLLFCSGSIGDIALAVSYKA